MTVPKGQKGMSYKAKDKAPSKQETNLSYEFLIRSISQQ